MPRRDGTGPLGRSAFTGRAAGYCGGYVGFGCGRGFGRGFGWWTGAPVATKKALQEQERYLEAQLKAVRAQLGPEKEASD